MKKKLLSLLLVIAIMMSSVSMGLSAFAAPAGKGIEAINAFELTANTVNGTSGTATVNIKSKNSSYKIKVNSITGYYKYMKEGEDTSKTVSFSIGSDNICGTSDKPFSASVSIDANLSALIRYECNYDLVNTDGSTVVDSNGFELYKGMTGIGYGYISADGDEAGADYGSSLPEPTQQGSYGFKGFIGPKTLYVQVPSITCSCTTEVPGNTGSTKKSVTVAGNPPSTLSVVENFTWPGASIGCGETSTYDWFVLTTPPSGYYKFNITYYDGQSNDIVMYYREDAHKNTANTEYKKYLAEGREKSYYDETSWNKYIAALDKVALVAIATHNDNYAFQVACQTAAGLSDALSELETAKQGLTQVGADYSKAYDAWYYFNGNTEYNSSYTGAKNKKVSVTTYTEGSTSSGSEEVDLYSEAAIQAVNNYVNSIDLNLKKCDQNIVDGYELTIRNMTANLAYAGAVYTYLDVAIEEYANTDSSIYTTSTWNRYTTAVNDANSISESLTTDSQYVVNDALEAIIIAKNALVKRPAKFEELSNQINRADEIFALEDGMLLTAAEGFSKVWDGFIDDEGKKVPGFEELYNLATSKEIQDATIDEQSKVDEVAYKLGEAVNALARYRLLDTSELYEAYLLKPPTEYGRDKYEPTSYDTWAALRQEALTFYQKSQATYSGSDRKTYENYEEMVRLTEVLINAFENLEKIKADFTKINYQVSRIPSDDVLALYDDEIVGEIRRIVKEDIDYGATFDEQEAVDAVAKALEVEIDKLTEDNYKPADYSDVKKAISEAEAIDWDIVTNDQIVTDAINAVDWNKKIVEQDKVNEMAAAIREAIKKLEYVLADYSDVEKAIEKAEAIEHKEWYANYNKVEAAINAVDWETTINKQDDVDAMAAAIREAIGNLKLADADYSGIRDAIALFNAQAPLMDFEPDTVAAVDLAIAKVEYGYMADRQDEVDGWEKEIRAAIEKMKLLPADYSRLKAAIKHTENYAPDKYTNYQIVRDAIDAVNWDLTCRDFEEMQAQIDAINNAVDNLQLKPADYSKVDEAIEAARYAYNNGGFPYTQESIAAVEAVIASINRDYDIEHQADVDAYITKIQIAVTGLTYVRADYTELDKLKEEYNNLDRSLYVNLSAIDTFVNKTIDWNKTIDKQDDVKKYVETLAKMLGNLEYADADYSAVDNEILQYNEMEDKELLYNAEDIAVVDQVIASVERGLKKNEQARVDKMAEDIRKAVADLKTKMKRVNLDKLTDAVVKANAKIDEMLLQTDYKIDIDTYIPLESLLIRAGEYNEETTIDNQKKVDDLAEDIIEATANLEFVFQIALNGTDLVIKDGYIYGFEEGTTSEDAKELIKFVGAAEIKITEMKNGFGTGTIIQFISTKDGSLIETYTVLVFGDANGDAVIDMFDVAYAVELVNGGSEPSEILLRVLDVSKDNSIDILDVTVMIGLANMDATLKQDGSMGKY